MRPEGGRSSSATNVLSEKEQNALVEKYLVAEKKAWSRFLTEPKLLILGTSDSGKSTLLKQLKIMHGGGFSKEELSSCAVAIRKHIRNSSKVTMLYMMEKNIELPSLCEKMLQDIESVTSTDEVLSSLGSSSESLSPNAQKSKVVTDRLWEKDEVFSILKIFWDSPVVKEAFGNLPPESLPPTNEFFVENYERIFADNYIPTNEDVLKLRTVTQSISKTEFNISGHAFHFYDVSGLKHHRKYWIPYFDNVSSILFVVDISAYDQMMIEDKTTNRLMDSLVLFDQISNNSLLAACGIILFLNKRDLFDKKAKLKSIKDFFPEYTGKLVNNLGKLLSISQSADFVKKRFQATTTKKVLVHYTCATNTDLMQKLLVDVLFHITSESLKVAGI